MRKATSWPAYMYLGLVFGAAVSGTHPASAQTAAPVSAAANSAAGTPPAATSPNVSPGWAIPGPPPSGAAHYDLNTPVLPTGPGGVYDLNVSSRQNGPPGTIVMTSTMPAPVFDIDRMLANTHGYVSAGVSTRNGHNFEGGVTMPIVPGRADLDLGVATGQAGGYAPLVAGGKRSMGTYDAYYAGLALHPTDDISAYIGISGLRLHAPGPYAYPYASPYSLP